MPTPTRAPIIVIVDDEIDILLSLCDVLKELIPEAIIFPAGSAKEALEFACDRPVDLVITDYRMPDMNGEELLRVLKESRSKPASIMMTAYPSAGLVFRTETECQSHAVFSKPFDASLMAEKARSILEKRARDAATAPAITTRIPSAIRDT